MITTYWRNILINLSNGSSTSRGNDTLYLALSTTTPNVDGTGVTEPSSTVGYARALLGIRDQSATRTMTPAANGESHNEKQISFHKATGAWGTCTYACLYDAATGGNLIWYGPLTTPISPVLDHVAIVEEGQLSISLT